jgi:mannose-6-phosphate isomerase-like protein (cupin superfamily)
METTDRAKHVPPGEGASFWVAGGSITLKVVSEDTDGAFAVLEEMTPPQGGPPPHINHREDETFCVLEGELEFTVNDRTIPATTGSVVYVPKGTSHVFRNAGTTPSRMLILAAPAGMERFFEEVGEPAANTPSPPPFGQAEMEKILAAFPKYGVELLGPPQGAHT